MNTAELKAIVRRYYAEIWNNVNLAAVDEIMAVDYVNRDPATPAPGGELQGRDGMKGLVSTYKATFPDLTFTITSQIAEGNVVASSWIAEGTMLGALNGLPANGKHGSVTGITLSTFRDGQIVEDDVRWDTLGLLTQLGFIPEPAHA